MASHGHDFASGAMPYLAQNEEADLQFEALSSQR